MFGIDWYWVAVSCPTTWKRSFDKSTALTTIGIPPWLGNHTFSVAIRLGLPICQEHKCVCGSLVDTSGRHELSCLKITGRYIRHHGLNDIIKRSLGTAGFPAILEPPFLTTDCLTLIPWQRGRSLVWDATCVDTFAKVIWIQHLRNQEQQQNQPKEKNSMITTSFVQIIKLFHSPLKRWVLSVREL